MRDGSEKMLDGLAKAMAAAMDPKLTEQQKAESFFEAMFGHDKYDDIAMHEEYDWHPKGIMAGKIIRMKITGLFDGNVGLLGDGISATHKVEEFRELLGQGVYTKV